MSKSIMIFDDLFQDLPDGWMATGFGNAVDYQEGPGILAKDFHEDGIPLIRLKGIQGPTASLDGANYLSPKKVKEKWDHFRLRVGDLLLSSSASLGRVSEVGTVASGAVAYTGIIRLRPKDSTVIKGYIKYFAQSPLFFEQVRRSAGGSVINHFGPTHLKQMGIALPPVKEQKAISHILGTLDDQIQLNQKTNKTLEGIAKTLFKSWFVDFDPVKAKAAGRPTGLPDGISELFPDSFEESELGGIPSGWRCRQLKDLIESIKDRQDDRLLEEFSATVTGIESRDDRFKKNLSQSSSKNRVAIEGDLVFGLSRRVINFGRMPKSIGAFSPVYEVFRSLPGAPISTKLIEGQIRQRMGEFMVILKPAAREGQAIDREMLLEQSVLIPSDKVISVYETYADLVENRIKSILENIEVLGHIRDALLPRLVSGELRVPDAEKMLEEVGI